MISRSALTITHAPGESRAPQTLHQSWLSFGYTQQENSTKYAVDGPKRKFLGAGQQVSWTRPMMKKKGQAILNLLELGACLDSSEIGELSLVMKPINVEMVKCYSTYNQEWLTRAVLGNLLAALSTMKRFGRHH